MESSPLTDIIKEFSQHHHRHILKRNFYLQKVEAPKVTLGLYSSEHSMTILYKFEKRLLRCVFRKCMWNYFVRFFLLYTVYSVPIFFEVQRNVDLSFSLFFFELSLSLNFF